MCNYSVPKTSIEKKKRREEEEKKKGVQVRPAK